LKTLSLTLENQDMQIQSIFEHLEAIYSKDKQNLLPFPSSDIKNQQKKPH
jgi:hypothetical protein